MLYLQSLAPTLFYRDPLHTSGSETFFLKKTDKAEYVEAPDWLMEDSYFQTCLNDRITIANVKSKPSLSLPSDDPEKLAETIGFRPSDAAKIPPRVRVQKPPVATGFKPPVKETITQAGQ